MSDTSISRRDAITGAVAVVAASTLLADDANASSQRNMDDALIHLRQARDSLQNARADKGGHRRKALDLIQEALREVTLGIKYADGQR